MRTAHPPRLAAPDVERSVVTRAQALARELLGTEGTRLQHVRTAGFVASRLAVLFPPEDAELLVTAATLHDIGYSPRIARTGSHALDGGAFLRAEGYPERLVALVANHSLALMTADPAAREVLAEQYPSEGGLLTDALAYADMHSAPDGQLIAVQRRLADIARRHADPREVVRAAQLRAAMARVGTALFAAQQNRRGAPGGTVVLTAGGDWVDLRDRPTDELGGDFDAWWSAEVRYARELDSFHFEASISVGVRDAALRLARLRSMADRSRDRYFRRALT